MGFSIVMVSGCALEVVGYLGRILASQDMFNEVSEDRNKSQSLSQMI